MTRRRPLEGNNVAEQISRTATLRSGPKAHDIAGPPHWTVLIVDDEPEVHEVTRMVLSNAQFCGSGIEIHSAYSTAEAKNLLAEKPDMALVLLDVVMETDDAGLELCRYVREDLHNDDVQIVLRTGQPGQAPEHDVILQYAINGYFLKTEITSQKLHSVLISSLRAYDRMRRLRRFGRTHEASRPGKHPNITIERLRRAIENDDLTLTAQPQVELDEGAVVGIELLPCWQTDNQSIPLAALIAIADRSGLTAPLSDWVLSRACALSRAWRSLGVERLRVAVNASPVQLHRGNLFASVAHSLSINDLTPEHLELEVTESAFMENLQTGGDTLRRLKALGIGIAVDNFGMGTASLSQLKRFQPDRLKIDPSLVQRATEDTHSGAVTRAIIALAHTLGIVVVAEGVGTQDQLDFLRWEGCEIAQGAYFSPPIPVAHIPTLLAAPDSKVQ